MSNGETPRHKNESTQTHTRRAFGTLAAAGAVGALAGCLDGDDTNEDTSSDEYTIDDQPTDARAEFITPQDGDTVTSPVQIEAAVENIELVDASNEPAVGEGHLHVNVDVECPQFGAQIPGPSDAAEDQGYYHWGDGSSEAELELEPGEHSLCLQLADGEHVVFGETETITVTVEEETESNDTDE